MGKVESPRCPTCTESNEMVHHFLFVCPKYTTQRGQLEARLWRATRSITVLLANPKAFDHLLRYIQEMHRFHNTIGDP